MLRHFKDDGGPQEPSRYLRRCHGPIVMPTCQHGRTLCLLDRRPRSARAERVDDVLETNTFTPTEEQVAFARTPLP
eukprot:4979689-Pleurochrysis_carterae.AAC.2